MKNKISVLAVILLAGAIVSSASSAEGSYPQTTGFVRIANSSPYAVYYEITTSSSGFVIQGNKGTIPGHMSWPVQVAAITILSPQTTGEIKIEASTHENLSCIGRTTPCFYVSMICSLNRRSVHGYYSVYCSKPSIEGSDISVSAQSKNTATDGYSIIPTLIIFPR